MIRHVLPAFVMLLTAACSPTGSGVGKAPVGAGGGSGAVEADIVCTRRCNRDFRICEDAEAVRRPDSNPQFGFIAQCQRQMSACLASCQPANPSRKPEASQPSRQPGASQQGLALPHSQP